MKLYLLRHAEAEERAASDEKRALTPQGIEQADRVAHFCRDHELRPSILLTSPFVRAHQTALAVTSAWEKIEPPKIENWLASGMSPKTAMHELKNYSNFKRVMLVGHEPDFSALAAALLGLDDQDRLHIRKASLTMLTVEELIAGSAVLEFSIPVQLM